MYLCIFYALHLKKTKQNKIEINKETRTYSWISLIRYVTHNFLFNSSIFLIHVHIPYTCTCVIKSPVYYSNLLLIAFPNRDLRKFSIQNLSVVCCCMWHLFDLETSKMTIFQNLHIFFLLKPSKHWKYYKQIKNSI